MQALMQTLERQLIAGAPGDQTLQLQGQPLWGPDQRVLNLNPKPVVGEAMAALGSDLSVALPFLLSLLGLRAGLMLQRRRSLLLQPARTTTQPTTAAATGANSKKGSTTCRIANANKRCNCSAPDAAIRSTISLASWS